MSQGAGDRGIADEKRVGFLVGGVQKSGTTALFDYLAEVPALELPKIKEAHFFDDEERVDWQAPDYAPYHSLFADRSRLWGEATPIYLYWPNALERIRAYNPAMKLIFIFRDPVERAWSHWKMEYARGKETEPFAWCIRDGRARMASGHPYPGFHRVHSYVERGFYGRQLARVLHLFPQEQVLLLASTALDRDPNAVIRVVCDFLEVPMATKPLSRRRSRPAANIDYKSTLAEDDVLLLRRCFREEMERFAQIAPDLPNWMI
ncbi:sulfotransferase domain-containing protein [Sphingomonas sp.]|uniref:sulfotransferase domain-containing protein n=1 Tax=Sphingomonas sp. TaxID=28214 RepID=UPI003B3A8496